MRYSIFDPTGNITALVEDKVLAELQPKVAAQVMKLQPKVEQVGFVHETSANYANISLRMAGGEFCGNASMCAAALYALTKGINGHVEVLVEASGASEPVRVVLDKTDRDAFDACVRMPSAQGIEERALSYDGRTDVLSIVLLGGISHIVIDSSSRLYDLCHSSSKAEDAVRIWCAQLHAKALGLMFLDMSGGFQHCSLTPLVYVPDSNTVYWENSCASGSAAVGMYVARSNHKECELRLFEPGGVLRVCSDPMSNTTLLYGHVARQS